MEEFFLTKKPEGNAVGVMSTSDENIILTYFSWKGKKEI